MTVYLVRHAETEWNLIGRRQGHADSPLTERGRGQAERIGEILVREREQGGLPPAPAIYCSPLGRARATAGIACRALQVDSSSLLLDPLLIECDHGDWTGLTNAEIEARDPESLRARTADKWNTPIPGGESYAGMQGRARDWLARVCGAEDETVVAVTHEMIGRALRGVFLGLEPAEVLRLTHKHGTVICLRDAGGARSSVELAA